MRLINIWDAGSAKAVAAAGAEALATGSWSVAAAQGYEDGEAIPLELLEQIIGRIVACIDLPLTVDFEGGYAVEPGDVAGNVARIISAGAVGINFEDRVIGGETIYDIPFQCRLIEAIRAKAESLGSALFINGRTDLFLLAEDYRDHAVFLQQAIERARAYRTAGASGFFAPGLIDEGPIETLCIASNLPVNILITEGAPSTNALGALGVSRVSHGPLPFIHCMQSLQNYAQADH